MKALNHWLASLAEQATPTLAECVEQLAGTLPLLLQFKTTPQDPEWHGEGDVWIHTEMVLQVLYQLLQNEADTIQGERRQALILAACLHDIAKPLTTRTFELEGAQRIGAPNHEANGRSYLAFKLMGLGLSFAVVWTVLNLVGEHHRPKRLVSKNLAAAEYRRVARQVDLELLYWLEMADMRGRFCSNTEWQVLQLDEFRRLSQHYGCWPYMDAVRAALSPVLQPLSASAKAYVYANALMLWESGRISQIEEAIAITYTHREQHAHLIILCGPSGAGKSTWLQQQCKDQYKDYERIALDDLREAWNGDRTSQAHSGQIRQQAKEQLKAALREKRGVIWDAMNLRIDFRSQLSQLARDYHALVTLVVFLPSEAALRQQNQTRAYPVADSLLQRQLASYQFPTLEEAHQFYVIGQKGAVLYHSGVW